MQDINTQDVEVLEDEFVPVPFAKLLGDPPEATRIIYDDLDHFTRLTRDQQGQLFRAIKRIKPHPEFQEQYDWLIDAMKEEMEYEDSQPGGPKYDPSKADEVTMVDLEDEKEVDPLPVDEIDRVLDKEITGGEELTDVTDIEILSVNDDVARKISRRSCILEFYQSEPTFKKKISAGEIMDTRFTTGDDAVDAGRLSVSKALLKAPELTSLMMHRRRFVKRLKEFTLPGGLLTLAGGQYLVPVTFVARVKDMVDEYAEVREELLNKFEERYPDIVLDAQQHLGSLFEEEDYPEFQVIRDACGVYYRFVPNTAPEFLKQIDPELYEAEEERVLDACRYTAAKIQFANRWKYLKQVEHLADRLGADEQGNPKQLHTTVVESFREFLHNFRVFDLTDDEQLGALIKDASNVLGNNTAEALRNNGQLRDQVKQEFYRLRSAASELVKTA